MTESYVYAIFTRGTDYYDTDELHSLYHSQEDAELKASELKKEVDQEYHIGELLYDEVKVVKLKVS